MKNIQKYYNKVSAKLYQVSDRKHPQVKTTVRFEGTKDECIDYVKNNYKNLSKHYFFDDKSFYKGDGAYYTDKRGLEVSIGPKK